MALFQQKTAPASADRAPNERVKLGAAMEAAVMAAQRAELKPIRAMSMVNYASAPVGAKKYDATSLT